MDSILLSFEVQAEMTEFMRNVYSFLNMQSEITPTTEAMSALLLKINCQIPPSKPELQKEIDEFRFIEPKISWTKALSLLGPRQLIENVHFIKNGNAIYFNTNESCYSNIENPADYAAAAQTIASLCHPAPTAVELETLYADKIKEAEAINIAQKQAVPTWEIIQRIALPDLQQENALLVFLDAARERPNWFIIVKNLKQMGEKLGYTYQHYTRCLHRFIGYYDPSLMSVAQQLSADELGQYLMSITVPEPLKELLSKEISCLIRQPGKNLRHIMAHLKALATGYYSQYPQEESHVLVNRVMILGLANFTTGKTRQAVSQMLEQAQLRNKIVDWSLILETAVKAEKLFGTPPSPMPFNPTGTATATLFSSMFLPIDQPVSHHSNVVDISLNHSTHSRVQSPLALTFKPTQYENPPVAVQKTPNHQPQRVTSIKPAPCNDTTPLQKSLLEAKRMLDIAIDAAIPHKATDSGSPTPASSITWSPEPLSRPPSPSPSSSSSSYRPDTPTRNAFCRTSRDKRSRTPEKSTFYQQRQDRPSRTRYNYQRSPTPDRYQQQYSSRQSRYRQQSPNRSYRDRQRSSSPDYDNQQRYHYQQRTPSRHLHPEMPNNYRTRDNSLPGREPSKSSSSSHNCHLFSPYRNQYPSNNRPSSPPRNQPSNCYRRYSPVRDRNQSNYIDDQPSTIRNHNEFSQPQSSRTDYHQSNSYRSQPLSLNQYSRHRPGITCSPDYKPWSNMLCKKCRAFNHHEHTCPFYYHYNQEQCANCNKGNHYASECKTTDTSHSIDSNQKQPEYHPSNSAPSSYNNGTVTNNRYRKYQVPAENSNQLNTTAILPATSTTTPDQCPCSAPHSDIQNVNLMEFLEPNTLKTNETTDPKCLNQNYSVNLSSISSTRHQHPICQHTSIIPSHFLNPNSDKILSKQS